MKNMTLAAALLLCSMGVAEARSGLCSFYGHESGSVTANGERFNPAGMTAAHWTLPFGTRVRVTDLATGRSVDVRINDRGPHPRLRREVDLAHGAAKKLGIIGRGLARVSIAVL